MMIPDYADRSIALMPHVLLPKLSLILGAVPLVCGILIFLVWIPSRSNVFEMLGLLNIVVGVVLVFAGFVCLGIFGTIERVLAACDNRKAKRAGLLPLMVLLANFPACIGIIAAANRSLHGYDGGAIVVSFTRADSQTETVEVHDGSDADDTPAGEILGVDVTDTNHVLAPYQSLR